MLANTKTRMIEALRDMVDELCSANLTLSRAKALRPQLLALLEGLKNQEAGSSEESRSQS
jgi:hypothetical protein